MKGWPASAEIEPMLQIAPSTPSRIISLIASCIRKNGPRTLTENIRSNRSGEVSRIVPRSVDAPAFTRTFTRPKRLSASAIMRRQSSTDARSPRTKRAGTPEVAAMPSATAAPRSSLRPVTTIPAAPAAASRRAIAAPRPCVAPATTQILPSMRFTTRPRSPPAPSRASAPHGLSWPCRAVD